MRHLSLRSDVSIGLAHPEPELAKECERIDNVFKSLDRAIELLMPHSADDETIRNFVSEHMYVKET